ncbi:MAG: hypothetical protein ACR2FY_02320 [Pirellulaceae bacterium]
MSHKPLDRDTTIADIHQTRERISAKFGGDIAAILEDARRRQEEGGRPIWSGAKETPKASQPGDKSNNLEVGDQSPAAL